MVSSALSWCIVLLEDEHVSSNSADRWQQFLHQQSVSVLLAAHSSPRLNENEVTTA